MAEIRHGVVAQVLIDGSAIVRPTSAGQSVTPPLPCQEGVVYINGLETYVLFPIIGVGDHVAFVLFEDGSGAILARLGGVAYAALPSEVGE